MYLFGVDYVHDHTTLQHLCKAGFDRESRRAGAIGRPRSTAVGYGGVVGHCEGMERFESGVEG